MDLRKIFESGTAPLCGRLSAPYGALLTLKCTKSFVGWGSAPDPAGGAYSAPPDLLAGVLSVFSLHQFGRLFMSPHF